jgi:hypothetical protein
MKKQSIASLMLRCCAFLMILVLLLVVLSGLFLPKSNREDFGMEEPLANGILGERENSIDVVILGDSETYSAFSPMQMWEEQGFTSYVCGTSSQRLYYTCQMLNRASKNQQPQVVVLETNTIYRRCKPDSTLGNAANELLPVFQYHNRWKSLNVNDFGVGVNYTYTTDFKGFYIKKKIASVSSLETYMKDSTSSKSIYWINEFYLEQIRTTCEKNNIQLVLVSTPSTVNWNTKKHNGIQNYADQYDIPYLDMNQSGDELGIDWQTDTRDKGDHLNYSGAEKASAYLGQWLKDEFQLTDHRDDDAYHSWNDSLQRYLKKVEQLK